MRCSGIRPTAESLKQIKEDFANGRLTVGTCAKCFRKNLPARGDRLGGWMLKSHDKPTKFRPGKRGSK